MSLNGNGEKKTRVLREISAEEEHFLLIANSIKYGSIEKIEMREGIIRRFKIAYDINLDDLPDVKKKLDELRSIPLD